MTSPKDSLKLACMALHEHYPGITPKRLKDVLDKAANGQDERPIDLISVKEAAEFLGVCPLTVYRMVWSGRLPAVKVGNGRSLRVNRWDLLDHAA